MEKALKVPRQVKSQQVKEKIFKTAQELMRKHGYEYVTVNNVCCAAGVSSGSFYHHFANKDQLLAYYFIAGYRKYQDQFDAVTGPDVIKKLIAVYDLHIAFCMEQDIGFMKTFYTPLNKSLRSSPGFETECCINLPVISKTVEVIELAKRDGYIPETTDAGNLAFELCAIIKGCIFEWCLAEGTLNLPEVARSMLGTYLNGVVTEKYKKDVRALPQKP